ncbi:MAG: hypothetical protein WA809_00140 [Candidatus Dormiibacterota bacterium]
MAVRGASCLAAATVAAESQKARGAPYHVGGYTCSANTEGAGSTWASAWGGTYFQYFCADGNDQVAFNWGVGYTYGTSSPT